jgi:hypothetical protein
MGATMQRSTLSTLGALALVVTVLGPAAADEAKATISVRSVLDIVSPVHESRETAYNRALRDPSFGPPPAPSPMEGQVLPDGSVRYGRTTITVKNPCPPGTAHYEPPPLPGRRR